MNTAHLSTIDLNLLVALAALLEERSITRAARRLGVTQSAMSRTLGRLRDLLGDPLFVRSGRGVVATARGEALAEPLTRLLSDAEELIRAARPFDPGTATRQFVVGTSDFVVSVMVPPLAARIAAEAPGVDLVLVSGASGVTTAALEAGEQDLAVLPDSAATPSLRRKPSVEVPFACLLRADHPAIAGGSLSLADYAALPHLLVAPRGRPGGIVDRALAERGLTRRVSVQVQTFGVAGEIVAGTSLVATLPLPVARAHAAHLPVRVVPTPIPVPPFRLVLLWHERQHHDPGHVWLRRLVDETVRAHVATGEDDALVDGGVGWRAV